MRRVKFSHSTLARRLSRLICPRSVSESSGKHVMFRLLSRGRRNSSSSLFPLSLPPFFAFFFSSLIRARSALLLLFSNCETLVLSYPRRAAVTARFYSARYRSIIYSPRHFTIVQRPSDGSYRPRGEGGGRRGARRVNFLQIGILLQFASSSIILASPQNPPPRARVRLSVSRLQLLFMLSLSFTSSPPLSSLSPSRPRRSADLGCLQSIRDLSKCR